MREAEIVIHMIVRSPNDGGDIILGDSISQLLLDHIEVVDIGLVVLAVVDLHDLGRDHLHVGIVGIGWINNQLNVILGQQASSHDEILITVHQL